MSGALGLWQGVGVEIEYMIVDAATLDVKPVADQLLGLAGGARASDGAPDDVHRGPISWSNELALHVVEIKTTRPVPGFGGLAGLFQKSIREITAILRLVGARLMPGGMHPWMDPARELTLWPHEYNEVYRTFDRVFGCEGHGWANLQSTHLNLPFANDAEFARLHDAVRLVLPLVPALAASSPCLDGKIGPALDNRLEAYRANAGAFPSVSGGVVPERVASIAEYHEVVLERIYAELKPSDPEGVLRHEWVNARGATARFERSAIEVRVIDAQECVPSDLAVAAAVLGAIRRVADSDGPSPSDDALRATLDRTIVEGRSAPLEDAAYRERLGLPAGKPATAGDAWRLLTEWVLEDPTVPDLHGPLRLILDEGPLAERIVHACGSAPTRERLREVYERLCGCVERGEPFRA